MTEAVDSGHCPSVERNARAFSLFLPLLLTTSACIVPLGKLGEEETDSEADSGNDEGASGMVDPTGDSGDPGDTEGDTDGPVLPTERQVDILFVLDNSGSMAEEQAKLASSIDALVATLDAAAVPVDYRIAVTTTDNGNPWCNTTGPEAGRLRATSCRARPEEFTFNGAVVVEGFDEACAALCPEGIDELGIEDGVPWVDVQRSSGTTNVAGDAVLDNLRCMLPQGIDGCGFEQPLESTWKAMARFESPGEASFGFHRPGALLAVMLVSDEVDCSYNAPWDTIFLPDGNRVFWSDDTAASPTSAVCWNAGVTCSDVGMGVFDCESVDYTVDADPGASPADAVLHPVERYTGSLIAAGAYVSAIYGVTSDGSVSYREGVDAQFESDYAIAPGCESASGRAVPPVRMREVVTTLGGTQSSICDPGYEAGLTAFAQGILARLP